MTFFHKSSPFSRRVVSFATLISDMRLSHYAIVGGTSAVIDTGLLLLCLKILHTNLFVATAVGFMSGLVVNFILNKLWSFKSKAAGFRKTQKEIQLYAVLVCFNLGFTYITVSFLTHLGFSIVVAKLSTIIITTSWNYIIYKKIIFK